MTSARQRVVFILPTLLAGGAERVLITLMNAIDRAQFDPHFIVLDERGPLRGWIAQDIPFHSLGKTKIRHSLPKLIKTLNRLSPDIVVSTMAAMNFTVLLAKPFLKRHTRIIVREAVIPSSIIEAQKFPGMVKAAYRRLYPRADLVLSPAQCIIEEFKNYLKMDTRNHVLLHNPVDTARLLGAWSIDTEISDDRKKTVHFVASGRLHKQKGFDRLIEALPRLKMQHAWKLLILGIGPEQENLERMIAQNGLEHHVTLAGLSETPWVLYAAADAFLLPSRWEGLPNVVLESLAVGTPVIAMKNAGGTAEIAGLAAPGKVKLASSMEEFIKVMEQVKPDPAPSFRPSLLPESFQLAAVSKAFSNLLAGTGSSSRP